MEEYFSGKRLYGDDFDLTQINAWYLDEKEGYANIGSANRSDYRYSYHALNTIHGFQYLQGRLGRVLSFGGAYGDELHPIIPRVESVVIIEPSEQFRSQDIADFPVQYITPTVDGTIPFANKTFDLILCFGVLHHIPNVSYVISEFARVSRSEAILLIREPIVSMGDWRKPRGNLTPRERGIPIGVFRRIFTEVNLEIVKESFCIFPPLKVLKPLLRQPLYNSKAIVQLDRMLALATKWNYRYHATTFFQKIRPSSAFFVLKKRPFAG